MASGMYICHQAHWDACGNIRDLARGLIFRVREDVERKVFDADMTDDLHCRGLFWKGAMIDAERVG